MFSTFIRAARRAAAPLAAIACGFFIASLVVNAKAQQTAPAISRAPGAQPTASATPLQPRVNTPITSATFRLPGTAALDPALVKRAQEARLAARNSYTGRPILAVGKLEDLNMTSMTLKLTIERDASSMPLALRATAKRIGTTDQLTSNELPTERVFSLSPAVLFTDARPSPAKPQTRAVTGQINEDKQRLKPSDFSAGDRIGVLFRRGANADEPARVLTVSKVDATQKNFDVDANPVGPNAMISRRTRVVSGETTNTVILPPGAKMPPRAMVTSETLHPTPAPTGK